jgi:endonuclease/exonuclease/phosphatase family metal-dependent hydrolase
MRNAGFIVFALLTLFSCKGPDKKETIRFATFNTALYREEHGILKKDLEEGNDEQIKIIAEIIQRVRPDVLALQEFDYDPRGKYLEYFQDKYLSKSFNNSEPITYRYMMAFPSNTGIPTDYDLNNDGKKHTAEDSYGYGQYPGQYAFALLSKYPLDTAQIKTFQEFLWKDMPGALLPVQGDSTSWYSPEELDIFRLSSKNHVDVPVTINGHQIHVLMAHPTPPGFDGEENRNGKRNHDEIRLLADYISPEGGDFLTDDKGRPASLTTNDTFVIMGDMNADPEAGDSYDNAIDQLLLHPRVHPATATGSLVPSSKGSRELHQQKPDEGHPAHNTATFGLRVDYVLPSKDLAVKESAVFWPAAGDSLSYLTRGEEGSDHRLVWVDVEY